MYWYEHALNPNSWTCICKTFTVWWHATISCVKAQSLAALQNTIADGVSSKWLSLCSAEIVASELIISKGKTLMSWWSSHVEHLPCFVANQWSCGWWLCQWFVHGCETTRALVFFGRQGFKHSRRNETSVCVGSPKSRINLWRSVCIMQWGRAFYSAVKLHAIKHESKV